MKSESVDVLKNDRLFFTVVSPDYQSSDANYWKTLTPGERLIALETNRQLAYGQTLDTAQLQIQRVFEVLEREES